MGDRPPERTPRLRDGRRLVAAVALALAASPAAASASLDVDTGRQRLQFSRFGARPVSWQACDPGCAEDGARRATFNDAGDAPQLALRLTDRTDFAAALDDLPYGVERTETDEAVTLRFVSEPLAAGLRIEKTYRIRRDLPLVRLDVRILSEDAQARVSEIGVRLIAGRGLLPPPVAGFAGSLERVRVVSSEGGTFDERGEDDGADDLAAGEWAGVRNRFWALTARPSQPARTVSEAGRSVELRVASGEAASFTIYAGPIRYATLRDADPELTGLLFHDLWFWMRWLTLGLLFLWEGVYRVVGSPGLSVILTAVAVKVLMLPLTSLAERWQRRVNETQSFLKPRIDGIKADHKGHERHQRILALYEEHGIHPLFGLKSLVGVLLQIPIFFAAYHMLGENFELGRAGFLWIRDLAKPDRLASLPFDVPFFGDALNLLPFVMTAVTLLSSWKFDDGTLSPALLRRQRRNLYVLAAFFFFLFYTFPAGMVLYWTTNNVLHLLKENLRKPPRGS